MVALAGAVVGFSAVGVAFKSKVGGAATVLAGWNGGDNGAGGGLLLGSTGFCAVEGAVRGTRTPNDEVEADVFEGEVEVAEAGVTDGSKLAGSGLIALFLIPNE